MKTTHNTNSQQQIRRTERLKYDWFDYSIATERVRDIRPFSFRKTIPSGCFCIKEVASSVVKCRYYNDTSAIIRCELLGVDSKEYPCLKNTIKVCIEKYTNIINHKLEQLE